jgi:phospholipid-transporting ATPase
MMNNVKFPNTLEESRRGLRDFLLTMALCHTVVPELNHETGEVIYQSQSPDESALVETAATNGNCCSS